MHSTRQLCVLMLLYCCRSVVVVVLGAGNQIDVKKQRGRQQGEDVFVATEDWQKIQEGQAIPPGLHVRMNLRTGDKEAKLLDSDEDPHTSANKNTALYAVPSDSKESSKQVKVVTTAHHVAGMQVMEAGDGEQTVFSSGKLTSQQLEEALKNFKYEEVQVASDEDKARVKLNFRSTDELKKDLADLNLGLRTEEEAVKQLLERFLKADATNDTKLSVLQDLEFLTHHVDAAKDLVDNKGIQLIIIPSLNSSSASIRSAAAKLIGSASQGNPVVQLAALKEGVISLVLRQLSIGLSTSNKDQEMWKSMLYAISCLVRGFPAGQRSLISEGGLSILGKLFDVGNMNTKLRLATFWYDLIVERRDATVAKEQYQSMKLEMMLEELGWCDKIASLVFVPDTEVVRNFVDLGVFPEHDLLEKTVLAMTVLAPHCKQQFRKILPLLKSLENIYRTLAVYERSIDNDDTFYGEFLLQIETLSRSIRSRGAKEDL